MVEGTTEKDAKLYINGQQILVNDDGKFRENITLQSGTNLINIRAVNRFEKEAMETLTVKSDFQPEEPANQESSMNNENGKTNGLELEIRVDPGPVWLSVESDGNLVFSGTMLTGATQRFRAEKKILINSGKADATFVKFNGKEIGALGKDGNPVRGVTFTADTKY